MHIHAYKTDILFIHKKEENPATYDSRQSENIRLNVISQTQKDRYYMISLIWNLKKKKKSTEAKSRITMSGKMGCGNWSKGINLQLY